MLNLKNLSPAILERVIAIEVKAREVYVAHPQFEASNETDALYLDLVDKDIQAARDKFRENALADAIAN